MSSFLLEVEPSEAGLDAIRIIRPPATSRNAAAESRENRKRLQICRENRAITFVSGSGSRVDYNRFSFGIFDGAAEWRGTEDFVHF
jgi:hypothetical protein